MKDKKKVLSVVLAILLIVSAVVPETLFASANNGYINEDCFVKNTFDEENVVYSSEEIEADGKTSYVTSPELISVGEYKLSRHGKFEENSGVDDSNAIRFYQVRGSSETDKDVSYIRILNTDESKCGWFVPDANTRYSVKISYKAEKNYKFVIREVSDYGEISFDDKTISVFANQTTENGWTIASAEFTTNENTTSVYIALVTENGECDSEAEVYIDNIAVFLPDKLPEKPAEPEDYSSSFNDVDKLYPDGWKAYFSANPQGGVPFTEVKEDDLGTYYEDWKAGAGGYFITRSQKKGLYNTSNNADNEGTFTNMAALTYTKSKYKYFKLSVEYRLYGANNPWPVITFNQQDTTPKMFYSDYGVATDKTFDENPIAISPDLAGSIRVFGKKASGASAAPSPSFDEKTYYKMEITVTEDGIHAVSYNADGTVATEYTTALPGDYNGGYITLMQNGVNFFRNISITVIEEEPGIAEFNSYTSKFNDVDQLYPDGWKAYFSANPQGGVPFTEVKEDDLGTYYEDWKAGAGGYFITRSQKKGLYNTSNNADNEGTFTNMAALTYTKSKYKYFKLSVEYRLYGANNPWPVITFNQQDTTPKMFYSDYGVATDKTFDENPIAISPDLAGSIRVFGKKASGASAAPSPSFDEKTYYKMEITVTEEGIHAVTYNADGDVATEYTTALPEGYKGGYITLMQNGVNFFRNISITHPDVVPGIEDFNSYTSKFNDVDQLYPDGWKGYFSANPQGGVPFTEISDADFGKYYEDWKTGAGGYFITRSQTEGLYNDFNNWNKEGTFSNMAALTYTKSKYKYFKLSVEYKYYGSGNPWPAVTFNQQNVTPEMFYSTYGITTNPTYSEDPIAISPNYDGSVRVWGKKASGTGTISANMDDNSSPQYHKMEITVTPGKVHTVVYKADGSVGVEYTTDLATDYKGGYITLMQNGVTFFRNISITHPNAGLEPEEKPEEKPEEDTEKATYKSELNDVDKLSTDGWKGYFSADPQHGVPFTEISDADFGKYYEDWKDGPGGYLITRSQTEGLFNDFNNWSNGKVFTNMGALTYTKQKFKYFDLTIEYKYELADNPWPFVVINQPNITPEIFYRSSNVTNPTYGEKPIGISPNYAGTIRIFSKMITETKAISGNMDPNNSPQWHKLKISVTPGSLYVAVYNKDGQLALDYSVPLDDSYEGGYITLMQNGVSHFRNISITERKYTFLDMKQEEGSDVRTVDLDESQVGTILVSTAAKRGCVLKSISAVSKNGVFYTVSESANNVYQIQSKEPIRITVTYQERKLDYDPEYTIKYYFDVPEELEDFTAASSPHPQETSLKAIEASDRWQVVNNVLTKPVVDTTGASATTSYFADYNILMLKDVKFRNFELTVQYMHGSGSRLSGGVIFGLQDPTVFGDYLEGGIFAAVEADGRGTLYGKSLRNADVKLQPYEGDENIPGYPKWNTSEIHTMKLRVIDGRVEMIIDDKNTDEPIIGIIPDDYYGHIALAVGNNKGWFDNLTIQPLDEWGNKITLEENEKQSAFNPEDIETDTWTDNREWD